MARPVAWANPENWTHPERLAKCGDCAKCMRCPDNLSIAVCRDCINPKTSDGDIWWVNPTEVWCGVETICGGFEEASHVTA